MEYYAGFPDSSEYLVEESSTETATDDVPPFDRHSSFEEMLADNSTFHVIEGKPSTSGDSTLDYLRSCIEVNNYRKSLSDTEFRIVMGTVQDGSCERRVRRCMFIFDESEKQGDATDVLTRLTEGEIHACLVKFLGGKNGVFRRKNVRTNISCDVNENAWNAPVRCAQPTCKVAPFIETADLWPVFHSLERVISILKKVGVSDIPEVSELLDIAQRELYTPSVNLAVMKSEMRHSFVVIEGLDGTGKTTLIENMGRRLGTTRKTTQRHRSIKHLSTPFYTQPEIVRRAYTSLSNYISAMEIARACQHGPIVADRYWHSTAVLALANECSLGDLPPIGHVIYNWPEDLLRPDFILRLTVDEEIRRNRVRTRRQEEGEDLRNAEYVLEQDGLFRARIKEAYRCMLDPSAIILDVSRSSEEVLDMVENVLVERGFH